MKLGCQDAFVALAGQDFPRLVGFYQQLLERAPQPLIPQIYAEFQLPGLRLAIFNPKAGREFNGPSSGAMSVCLEVKNLDAAIAHVRQIEGSTLSAMMTASHGREIYLFDPAGNRLILHQTGAYSSRKDD
ncbi:MAG: VOC family protein [Cyanobacteria bacterium P01_H01_bin.119]